MQEVFVKIYHNFDKYDKSKAKPLTWMVTIARNHSIDFYRKKKLLVVDDFDLSIIDDEQIQILEQLEQDENKAKIIKCLRSLKSNIRDAIFMQYFYNMTFEQIAKNFDTPTNTVKSWVNRGLPKLKICLENL